MNNYSSTVTKLTKDDEDSCGDNEKDNISEGTPIVRSKNTKKGPFDFDGTRLVQELNNEHTVILA